MERKRGREIGSMKKKKEKKQGRRGILCDNGKVFTQKIGAKFLGQPLYLEELFYILFFVSCPAESLSRFVGDEFGGFF
jgi:hypothetical protein